MLSLSNKTKVATDILFVSCSLIGLQAILYRGHAVPALIVTTSLILVYTASWLIVGRSMGLYQDLRLKPFSYEWVIFFKTLVLYTLIVSFVSFQLFKSVLFIRWILFYHCLFIFFVFPAQKLIIRAVFKRLRFSDNMLKKVLIVGSGETGMDFYHSFVKDSQFGYTLAGFVDEHKNPSLNGSYLGKISDIETVISKHELDDIVITPPHTSDTALKSIVDVAEKEGKRIHIVPDLQQYITGRVQVRNMGNFPVITLRSQPLDNVENQLHKRVFDILFSFLVIVFILSWLFPIIALLIKLSSKGPVLFKQERWGLYNRPIICYKFRSMVASSKDVDASGKYQQASKGDPRITALGRFLRKSNFDELPQFFNVLNGSMSIVGPRPHPVPLNLLSKNSIDNYMMRNWVKPGITGYAQVKGYRGETKDPVQMQNRVKADIWYMENWTLWLDLQIIVQTVVNMVKGEENAI